MSALDRALQDGETPLFEGGARSARPGLGDLTGYGCLVLLGALMLLMGWTMVRGHTTWGVEWTLGTVQFSGSTTGPSGTNSAQAGLPNPLAFLFLVALLELYRQASVRSLRLLVTPGRVLTSRGVFRTKIQSYLRTGEERAVPGKRGATLAGLADGATVQLLGYEGPDVEALTHALQTFEACPPPPPPPPPLWSSQRLAVASVFLLIGLTAWGAWRATRPPTLIGSWTKDTIAMDRVELTLDYPGTGSRYADALEVTKIEADGQSVPTKGSFGARGGFLRSDQHTTQFVPVGAQRLRATLEVPLLGGGTKTMTIDLRRGSDVSVEVEDP